MNSTNLTYGLVEKVTELPVENDNPKFMIYFKFGSKHITSQDLTSSIGKLVGYDSYGRIWS